MPPKTKTNIVTNLVGRTARPSNDSPWCWPWAWRFEPKGPDADAARAENRLDKHGRFLLTLYDERAKVVAVRGQGDGAQLLLESSSGEMSECYATTVALVPKGKPRTFTHIETHAILAGIEEASAYFTDGGASRALRDMVALKESDSRGMTLDAKTRRTIIAKLVATQHSYSLTRETDHGKLAAALTILRDGGRP